MDQLGRHVAQKSEQILTIFVIVKNIPIIRGWYFFETFVQFKSFYLKCIILQIPF